MLVPAFVSVSLTRVGESRSIQNSLLKTGGAHIEMENVGFVSVS
jgi:hypothetical protein